MRLLMVENAQCLISNTPWVAVGLVGGRHGRAVAQYSVNHPVHQARLLLLKALKEHVKNEETRISAGIVGLRRCIHGRKSARS